jgi:hypothetical protein
MFHLRQRDLERPDPERPDPSRPTPLHQPTRLRRTTTARSDDDLRLAGNIIATGDPAQPYATDGGCLEPHPTCGPAAVYRLNQINTLIPQLVDPTHGDFRPVPCGNVATTHATAIPNFTWSDAPTRPAVPQGTLDNIVSRNFNGEFRSTTHPGAY